MLKQGKLELTWVGKYEEKKIEPRILIEDRSKSYGDPNTENMLIHGDNLIALKALEQDYAGKIKCIYIDPPFNTGARINADGEEIGYEDGIEHSEWLTMICTRLSILKDLLSENGVIVVHLDNNEMAYCKVLLDELFGRSNYVNTITMTTNDPSGFKATGVKIFSTSNYLLIYAKNKYKLNINKVYKRKEYDTAYSKIFTNMNGNYKHWEWMNLKDYVCEQEKYSSVKEMQKELGTTNLEKLMGKYAIKYADSVFRTAAIGGGAKKKRQRTIDISKDKRNEIFMHEGEDVEDFYILNGEQIVFYKNRLAQIDGELAPAEIITDVWTDISWTGIANEGGVVFKNGKKPELLIKRVLDLFTEPFDIVLDSFLGSGTTAAVAHKMNRKWIGIEMGPQCYSHCLKRLKGVVDGSDQSGISKIINWQGGGGFKFYELAEPLLIKNSKLPIYSINPSYTFDMMAEAICKIEGFKYKPIGNFHGKSSENRFIHVTNEFVNSKYVFSLVNELEERQSLLIYCTKMQSDINLPDNVEIKKIPKDLLNKCSFESEGM